MNAPLFHLELVFTLYHLLLTYATTRLLGCWVVSECVLDELKAFFPALDDWMKKATGTPAPAATASITDCPF